MAPRGRKKKAGLMRADGARDAMRAFGFPERLINVCIKELLEVYGEEGWFLIEECSYSVLLNKCLEKSDEQDQNVVEDRIEERAEEQQNNEIVEAEQEQNDEMMAEPEEEQNNEIVEAEQVQNDEMVAEAEQEQNGEKMAEAEEEQNDETVAEAEQEQNDEMVVEAEEEQTPQKEEEKEQEQLAEDGKDHVGSNSTSQVGCVAETGTQTEALSITSETEILDSSPAGEASVIDFASPAAFPSADASGGFAQRSAAGAKGSRCGGWISDSDEDEDPVADSGGDDDEMIQLTPEPLCEELEELIKEIRGEKKKKRTRWED